MEVEVKFTGTPAQTLSGEAVKFAVGACAIAVKKLPINYLKKHDFQLVVIPSMRTPINTIHYAREFFGDNHTIIMDVDKKAYLSALALSENIIVTCDSSSMISEAALTGKPIYIASILPRKNDKRFQSFRNLFRELNITRNLGEEVENWNYQKLDETNRVANIIKQKINS